LKDLSSETSHGFEFWLGYVEQKRVSNSKKCPCSFVPRPPSKLCANCPGTVLVKKIKSCLNASLVLSNMFDKWRFGRSIIPSSENGVSAPMTVTVEPKSDDDDVSPSNCHVSPPHQHNHPVDSSVDVSLMYHRQYGDSDTDHVYLSPNEIYDLAANTSILGHTSILGLNHSMLGHVPEECEDYEPQEGQLLQHQEHTSQSVAHHEGDDSSHRDHFLLSPPTVVMEDSSEQKNDDSPTAASDPNVSPASCKENNDDNKLFWLSYLAVNNEPIDTNRSSSDFHRSDSCHSSRIEEDKLVTDENKIELCRVESDSDLSSDSSTPTYMRGGVSTLVYDPTNASVSVETSYYEDIVFDYRSNEGPASYSHTYDGDSSEPSSPNASNLDVRESHYPKKHSQHSGTTLIAGTSRTHSSEMSDQLSARSNTSSELSSPAAPLRVASRTPKLNSAESIDFSTNYFDEEPVESETQDSCHENSSKGSKTFDDEHNWKVVRCFSIPKVNTSNIRKKFENKSKGQGAGVKAFIPSMFKKKSPSSARPRLSLTPDTTLVKTNSSDFFGANSIHSVLPKIASPPSNMGKNDTFLWAYDVWRKRGLMSHDSFPLPSAFDPDRSLPVQSDSGEELSLIDRKETSSNAPSADENLVSNGGVSPLCSLHAFEVKKQSNGMTSGRNKFASILQQWRDKSNDQPNTHFLSPDSRSSPAKNQQLQDNASSTTMILGRHDDPIDQPSKPLRALQTPTLPGVGLDKVSSVAITLRDRRKSLLTKVDVAKRKPLVEIKQHHGQSEQGRRQPPNSRLDFKATIQKVLRGRLEGFVAQRQIRTDMFPLLGSDSTKQVDFEPINVPRENKCNIPISFVHGPQKRVKDLHLAKENCEFYQKQVETLFPDSMKASDFPGEIPTILQGLLMPVVGDLSDFSIENVNIPWDDDDASLSPLLNRISPSQFVHIPQTDSEATLRTKRDPPTNQSLLNSTMEIARQQSMGEQSASSSIVVLDQDGVCQCTTTVLNGNDDLIEFFLPLMGIACKCGRRPQGFVRLEEPTSTLNILRPWQVDFLSSLGIERGDQLVKAHHCSAQDLASALRYYRRKHCMTPFRTSSCRIALQIWSKTSKAFVRSIRQQQTESDGNQLNLPNTLYILSSFLDYFPVNKKASKRSVRNEDEQRGRDPSGIISMGEC
jgi:hypothetical protein